MSVEQVAQILLAVFAIAMVAYAALIFGIALKSPREVGETVRDFALWLAHGSLVLLASVLAFAALITEEPRLITAVAGAAVADFVVRWIIGRQSVKRGGGGTAPVGPPE